MKTLLAQRQLLEGLNEAQREAVVHSEGPLLIIAGAGTGKTSVITRRIAYLISTKKAKPEEILALTFTDKAATEMEERVDLLVPYGYTDMWISTFHAFGDRLLRESGFEIGLTSDFRVLTRPEQVIFFREHLFEFPLSFYRPLSDPTKFIEDLLTLISRARDEDIGPGAMLAYAEGLKEKSKKAPKDRVLKEEAQKFSEIATLYQVYEVLLLKEGKLDFANQVALCLELFRKRPSVLAKVQSRFHYILVDEFQDTNLAQFELVRLLAAPRNNITVCGDDDQSIYKFRGAAISNILGFMDHYPKAKQVVLTRNYRSTQRILDQAYRLIRYNNPDRLEQKRRLDKRLIGAPGGKPVEHWHFDTLASEADAVAAFIQERVEKTESHYEDFAILVRSNKEADPFIRALNMRGIPWRFSGNQGLYSREEVKLAISFLRLMTNLDDNPSLFHLASSEMYELDMAFLTRASHLANRLNRSLFSVLKESSQGKMIEDLSGPETQKLERFLQDLENFLKKSRDYTTGQLLYEFLKESGTLSRLSKIETVETDAKIQNLAKFFEQVRNFEILSKEDRVWRFVAHLNLLMEAGDDPAVVEATLDIPAVNILTVHKAKGLEFDIVFMVSLVQRRFPLPHRKDPIELPEPLIQEILPTGDFHVQEERRLFYVGMTRAKSELYLTSAQDYGGERTRKVSQFVIEALDLPKDQVKIRKASALETLSRQAVSERTPTPSLPIGEKELISLSHYQLDDYLTCPLKYKYVHLLRLPVLQHHTVVYGRAVHAAIEAYYRRRLEGKAMTVKELLSTFEASWTGEGFLSREHEERRLTAGREALKRFHKEEKRKVLPTYVEKEFSFVLGNDRIVGRWDLVYEHGGEIGIADVKTSEIRSQEKAQERVKENLQLSIYALAYREVFGKIPDWVELRFLESGLVARDKRSESDLEKTVAKIKELSAGIRSRDFIAKPAYQSCRTCAYKDICPYAIRG